MKIAVTGHQSYGDRLGFHKTLDRINKITGISEIIITFSAGPCKFAKEWCARNGVPLEQLPQDRTVDARHNMRRNNKEVVHNRRPDLIIAVGNSEGAEDIERRARAAGISIMEIRVR